MAESSRNRSVGDAENRRRRPVDGGDAENRWRRPVDGGDAENRCRGRVDEYSRDRWRRRREAMKKREERRILESGSIGKPDLPAPEEFPSEEMGLTTTRPDDDAKMLEEEEEPEKTTADESESEYEETGGSADDDAKMSEAEDQLENKRATPEQSESEEIAKKARHDYDDAKMPEAEEDDELVKKTTTEESESKPKKPFYLVDDDEELDPNDPDYSSDVIRDYFFNGYDSDLYENNPDYDCFKKKFAEAGRSDKDRYPIRDEAKEEIEGRGCLDEPVCNIEQHHADFGAPVFELFKLILKFNDKCTTNNEDIKDGKLCGEFVKFLEHHLDPDDLDLGDFEYCNPFPISYYSAKFDKPDIISLDSKENKYIILPLHSPEPRPPFKDQFTLSFHLALRINDEDVFRSQLLHYNPAIFGEEVGYSQPTKFKLSAFGDLAFDPDFLPPRISRQVIGNPDCDRLLVCAKYAVYNGAWARIKVKMLKTGVRSFNGVIMARSCIFYSRIRLLTIYPDEKKSNVYIQRAEKGEVGEDLFIKLTRSVVTVPSYSSLIIGADLYDDEQKRICWGRVCFPAKETGEQKGFISCGEENILEITAEWACEEFY